MKRNVPSLSMRADIAPEGGDRRVRVTWTTGARVLRNDFFDGPFYEELSLDPRHVDMGRLNSGAPFLADHNASRVAGTLGVVESARLEGTKGVATVRFASEGISPDADRVFNLIRDGILTQVSVGYRVHKMEKVDDAKVPTYRAVRWEPFELSAVGIGADAGAGFRSSTQTERNDCDVEDNMADEKTPAEVEAQRAADMKAAEEAGAKAELERVTAIQMSCRGFKLGEDFTQKLIDAKATVDAAREAILNELARKSEETMIDNKLHVEVTEDAADKYQRGVVSGLLARAGSARVADYKSRGVEGFDQVDLNPGEFRRITLLDVARRCLEAKGHNLRGKTSDEIAKLALSLTVRDGGLAATSDFPVILENVLHKLLLGAYAVSPDSWRRWCGVKSVQDFRAHNFYRTAAFGVLDTVAEGGEYKNKSIPDGEKVSVTIAKKGNIIALTRELLINDDMGALADLASKLGRSAGLSIEKDAYDLLLENSGLGPTLGDSHPFFYTSRGNINASGSTISVAGLDADAVVMAAQTDPSGEEILDLKPAILVVAKGIEGVAKVVTGSQYDPTSGAVPLTPNRVSGVYRDIVGTGRLTGTRRYSFADPAIAPAFVAAFLNGQEAPFMEQQQGFRVDGLEWKVRLEYVVAPFDPRGAVTNAGT